MANRKKRILLCNEASFLNTGYATYGREVMKRWYASGKYDVAELSVYAHPADDRLNDIPWATYPNSPLPNNPEAGHEYHSIPTNQFGEWRFEEICLDFKPDIVVDIRDFWMLEFEERSPFRDLFHWVIMPTVDAEGQNEQWLATYANADAVFTYSDFAVEALERESGGSIKCLGSAPPSADAVYRPAEDKDEHKKRLGLKPETKIVGTVMRNQRRKLFPDLFETFRKFLDATDDPNIFLYCHTSYPDVGWDLPKLIKKYGLASKLLFTYVCEECSWSFPSFFVDSITSCTRCGGQRCGLSNVTRGVSTEYLSDIMNTFDLYIQYANSEGFGLPQVEAAACGVPVMSVDYSAMSSAVRKINGTPLKLKTKYLELETGCYRAIPDNDFTVEKLVEFFELSKEERYELGKKSREGFEKNYSYDKTAKIWEECFDRLPIREGIWESPPRLHNPSTQIPNDLTNKEIAKWLIINVLGDSSRLNSYMEARLTRDLNYGVFIEGTGSLYFNEDCYAYNKPAFQSFDIQEAYNQLAAMCGKNNYWEQRRVGQIQVPRPQWMPNNVSSI